MGPGARLRRLLRRPAASVRRPSPHLLPHHPRLPSDGGRHQERLPLMQVTPPRTLQPRWHLVADARHFITLNFHQFDLGYK